MSLQVTASIKKILAQRNAGILDGTEATYKLLLNLNRQIRSELAETALSGWDSYQLKQLQKSLERRLADYESAAKGLMGSRLGDLWDLGERSVTSPLTVGGIFSGFNLPASLLRTMEEFAFVKIESYTGTMWNAIRSELSLAALGARTPQQVSDKIGKLLPDGPMVGAGGRTIFKDAAQRGEFITKTELGRFYSEAADRRMKEAAKYVDDLEKIWHHGHPRQPRLTHLAADGVSRPIDAAFPVQDKNGYQLMYPHDSAADFSETAGCLCSHTVWALRWGQQPKAA